MGVPLPGWRGIPTKGSCVGGNMSQKPKTLEELERKADKRERWLAVPIAKLTKEERRNHLKEQKARESFEASPEGKELERQRQQWTLEEYKIRQQIRELELMAATSPSERESKERQLKKLRGELKTAQEEVEHFTHAGGAPAAPVETATPEHAVSSDADANEILAALFDPVPVAALEKMFPATGAWENWAERAARNGLSVARESRGVFNPFKAAVWFMTKNMPGWDWARCRRTLANNLPARTQDKAHLLTGELD